MSITESKSRFTLPRVPWWAGAIFFAAVALFFLWEEHEAHILGALPWLLLLACFVMHAFMHRGHGEDHTPGGGAASGRAGGGPRHDQEGAS